MSSTFSCLPMSIRSFAQRLATGSRRAVQENFPLAAAHVTSRRPANFSPRQLCHTGTAGAGGGSDKSLRQVYRLRGAVGEDRTLR